METHAGSRMFFLRSSVVGIPYGIAVVIAVCFASGLSYSTRTAAGVIASWGFVESGMPVEDLYYAMSEIWQLNAISHFLNLVAVFLGGVLVAWFVADRRLRLAVWVGVIFSLLTAMEFVVPYPHASGFMSKMVSLIGPVLASALGAVMYLRYRRFS